MEKPSYIIVIGASAGGILAISAFCAGLPAYLPRRLLWYCIMSSLSSGENLACIFQRHTDLNCQVVEGGSIRAGTLELAIEAKITENMASIIDELKQIGDKSDLVCPDCGGGLAVINCLIS